MAVWFSAQKLLAYTDNLRQVKVIPGDFTIIQAFKARIQATAQAGYRGMRISFKKSTTI